MTYTERSGLVQTVNGLVSPDQLGHTMMHEHIGRPLTPSKEPLYLESATDISDRAIADQPISLDNLWWVRYNMRASRDNLTPPPWDVWREEVELYKRSGGGTLVEVTPAGLTNIADLQEMSRTTGIHIVAGTGHYIDSAHDPSARLGERSAESIAEELVSDILIGDPVTGARAGILGEIGCSWPITPNERKVLIASAIAQAETGVVISIHPGRNAAAPREIADVLASAGADLGRVVMGHMDRCGYPLATRLDLLDRGLTIEYDVFGMEGYYPAAAALADGAMPDMPNDTGRIKEIVDLVTRGYEDRIVVGHDIHMRFQMAAYGGWGYGHFLRNVVPLARVWGLGDSRLHKLTVTNPARLLQIN